MDYEQTVIVWNKLKKLSKTKMNQLILLIRTVKDSELEDLGISPSKKYSEPESQTLNTDRKWSACCYGPVYAHYWDNADDRFMLFQNMMIYQHPKRSKRVCALHDYIEVLGKEL